MYIFRQTRMMMSDIATSPTKKVILNLIPRTRMMTRMVRTTLRITRMPNQTKLDIKTKKITATFQKKKMRTSLKTKKRN